MDHRSYDENHNQDHDHDHDHGGGRISRDEGPYCDLFREEVSRVLADATLLDDLSAHEEDGIGVGVGAGVGHVHNTWFDLECGSPLDKKEVPGQI